MQVIRVNQTQDSRLKTQDSGLRRLDCRWKRMSFILDLGSCVSHYIYRFLKGKVWIWMVFGGTCCQNECWVRLLWQAKSSNEADLQHPANWFRNDMIQPTGVGLRYLAIHTWSGELAGFTASNWNSVNLTQPTGVSPSLLRANQLVTVLYNRSGLKLPPFIDSGFSLSVQLPKSNSNTHLVYRSQPASP